MHRASTMPACARNNLLCTNQPDQQKALQ